jgi:hypothetical protein
MKRQQAVESWLQDQNRTNATSSLLEGIARLVGAAFVLFVTYWVIYVIIYLGFEWIWPHSHEVRLIIAGVVLVLLFIGNATTDRQYLEDLSFTTGTAESEPVTIYVPTVGYGSTINPLAPDSAHSYVKVITRVLFVGPRLATDAFRAFRRSRGLSRMDTEACAAVLTVLAEEDGPVPSEQIVPAIPRGHDPEQVLHDLVRIDGVRLETEEIVGLSLAPLLRAELRRVMKKGTKRRRKKREQATEESADD